jgi:hypothetical protein
MQLDENHKLGKFIRNNPPHASAEEEKKAKGAKGKKGKRGKPEEEEVPEGITPESPEIVECAEKLREAADKTREEISVYVRALSAEYSLSVDIKFYVMLQALFGDDIGTKI